MNFAQYDSDIDASVNFVAEHQKGKVECRFVQRRPEDFKYQDFSQKIVKIHGAIIKGENDDEDTWWDICEHIDDIGLKVDYQLVRYNPYSVECGEESPKMEELCELIDVWAPCKIVEKVGKDVHASCGMFK